MLRSRRRESMEFRDGARTYEVTVDPLLSPDGSLSGAVHVMRDASARKIAEECRQDEARRIHESRKVESLLALAGGVAHDFNNLLTAILGNAELARMELPAHSPLLPFLDEIATASNKAAAISRSMLAYAGRSRFQSREVDLDRLAAEALAVPEGVDFGAARVRRMPARGDARTTGDAGEIRRALFHLLRNAVEALEGRAGEIRVTAGAAWHGAAQLAQASDLEPLPEGRYAFLEVADDGGGIDEETQGRIFEPFFSTRFIGRGMGLPEVLGIMRAHRGGVRVESVPGCGTAVRLLFPAPREGEVPRASVTGWRHRGGGALLVVDDEPTVLRYEEAAFARLGFRTVAAGGGMQALERLADAEEPFLGVILDLTMPAMDGVETCRLIRERFPDLPVFVASGYGEEEIAGRFAGCDVAGFLEKPFDLNRLAHVLRAHFGG